MSKPEFYDDLDEIFIHIQSLLKKYSVNTNSYLHTPTLVTNCLDGRATARVVVLRSFDEDKKRLYFYTDKRSNKVEEIKKNSDAQLLFYSFEDKLQLRIDCELTLELRGDLHQEAWNNCEASSRLIYQQTIAPGKSISNVKAVEFDGTKNENGYENFAVIVAAIQSIECLLLHTQEEHRRCYFNLQGKALESSWLAA